MMMDYNISSLGFWVVFVLFLVVYTLLKRLSRTAMMLFTVAFGLYLAYSTNGPVPAMVILTVAVLNHWMTQGLRAASRPWLRRLWLTLVVLLDLSLLGYLKYANFVLSDVLNACFETNFAPLTILLPVGLSFFTFQAISYAVDVYRGRFREEVSLLEYCFYLTFFPLLLAGPITRARHLIPCLKRNRPPSAHRVWVGLGLVLLGLVKKVVFSDYIAQYNDWVFTSPLTFSGWENLMALVGYSAQLYLDFSGYSDVSIGMASLLGFGLPDNFRSPYHARSISDFWRRWHISLSTWFRDYIYIPLGGNRHGYMVMYLATMVTMLVAGLWHGASWMFLIWGAMHGLALVLHKCFSRQLGCRIPDTWWGKPVSWLLTFGFVTLSWIFFRAPDMDTAIDMCRQLVYDMDLGYVLPFLEARTLWMVVVLLTTATYWLPDRTYSRLLARWVRTPWLVKWLVLMAVIQLILHFRQQNVQPFIYYQF